MSQRSKSTEWLNDISYREGICIPTTNSLGGALQVPGTDIIVPGLNQLTKTVYIYHYDYWDGNPLVYDAEQMHPHFMCTFGDVYRNTMERDQRIKDLGFKLIVKWETE